MQELRNIQSGREEAGSDNRPSRYVLDPGPGFEGYCERFELSDEDDQSSAGMFWQDDFALPPCTEGYGGRSSDSQKSFHRVNNARLALGKMMDLVSLTGKDGKVELADWTAKRKALQGLGQGRV